MEALHYETPGVMSFLRCKGYICLVSESYLLCKGYLTVHIPSTSIAMTALILGIPHIRYPLQSR